MWSLNYQSDCVFMCYRSKEKNHLNRLKPFTWISSIFEWTFIFSMHSCMMNEIHSSFFILSKVEMTNSQSTYNSLRLWATCHTLRMIVEDPNSYVCVHRIADPNLVLESLAQFVFTFPNQWCVKKNSAESSRFQFFSMFEVYTNIWVMFFDNKTYRKTLLAPLPHSTNFNDLFYIK